MNEKSGPRNSIDQMLLNIWNKNYPNLLERVAVLQKVCTALAQGPLEEATRNEAHGAAHKLAGVLGTFGLQEGSHLASQLEASLTTPDEAIQQASFCEVVEKIRTLIEARQS